MPPEVIWMMIINVSGVIFMSGVAWANQKHNTQTLRAFDDRIKHLDLSKANKEALEEHSRRLGELTDHKVDRDVFTLEIHRLDEDVRQVRHAGKNLEQRVNIIEVRR